jgi:hypothetical protein
MWRRRLLLAVLIYVTLDLSLPSMPGAFVFDPGDSVESIQMSRGRTAVEAACPLAPARHLVAPIEPKYSVGRRSVPMRADARVPLRSTDGLHRATTDPDRPADDPH